MTSEEAERLWEALVLEIKAEMGRQDLSSRALGELIGESSQYMSQRLDGGNPKTGKRVILNVRDLSSIARALAVSEVELLQRAQTSLQGSDELARRRSVRGPRQDRPAAAKKKGRDRGGDDGQG